MYAINVFDTYEAAKLLNLKEKSLKYLLLKYCNVQTNGCLTRPLTQQLIDKSNVNVNLLKQRYNNSAEICKIMCKKPCFNVNGWKQLCQYNGWYFINNKRSNVLSKLYKWRDNIGRELDQSIGCVRMQFLFQRIQFRNLVQDYLVSYT